MTFQTDTPSAGLSLTLGTEVSHPRDVAEAYGDDGQQRRRTSATRRSSQSRIRPARTSCRRTRRLSAAAVSPQAAYVMTDILASNTDPKQNPIWGDFAVAAADGTRRPATLKTGTNQDANDLVAFGYLPPPDEAGRAAGEYALVVGAWDGNSRRFASAHTAEPGRSPRTWPRRCGTASCRKSTAQLARQRLPAARRHRRGRR